MRVIKHLRHKLPPSPMHSVVIDVPGQASQTVFAHPIPLSLLRGRCSSPAAAADTPGIEGSVAAATLAAELPSSPGGSFPAVFSQWLALGLLSRRRVAALAEAAAEVRIAFEAALAILDLVGCCTF